MKDPVPLNALIVEDEQDLCILLSNVLIQKNLRPTCVNSIADAKKNISEINPSILFLDNRLADGFGIDFISEIRHQFPAAKIVMMTAQNSTEEIDTALNQGADYFISKPFVSSIIKSTIDLLNLK